MNLPVFLMGSLWGGLYLEETHHLSHILSTFIASMLFVGIIIGSPIFGIISDKWLAKRKPPMLIGAILSLLFILIIIYIPCENVLYLLILFFILGVTSSAQCIGYPVIIENNKLAYAATATGIGSIIIMGGGAIIKVVYSWVLNYYWNKQTLNKLPIYSQHAFNSAMLILPVAFVLAIFTVLFIHETNCKAKEN